MICDSFSRGTGLQILCRKHHAEGAALAVEGHAELLQDLCDGGLVFLREEGVGNYHRTGFLVGA